MSDEQKKTMFGYAAPQMPSPVAPQAGTPAPQQAGAPAPEVGTPPPRGAMPPAVGHTPPPSAQQPHGQAPGQAQQAPQGYAQPQGQAPGQSQQYQQPQQGYAPGQGQPQQGYAPGQGQPQQGYAPGQGQPQQGQQYQQSPQGYAPGQGHPPQGQYQQAPQGYGPGQSQHQQQGYAPNAAGAPGARTASKALYLGLHFGGLALGLLLVMWGANDRKVQELIPFGFIAMLIGFVSFYVLLYKAWASINDGYAKTTPGKAVGFSFIPFFNIYWLFVAIGSWGNEYNSFTQRRGMHGGFQASSGLFTAHCVLQLVLGAVAFLITMPMVISQMCNGINSIAAGGLPRAEIRN